MKDNGKGGTVEKWNSEKVERRSRKIAISDPPVFSINASNAYVNF